MAAYQQPMLKINIFRNDYAAVLPSVLPNSVIRPGWRGARYVLVPRATPRTDIIGQVFVDQKIHPTGLRGYPDQPVFFADYPGGVPQASRHILGC